MSASEIKRWGRCGIGWEPVEPHWVGIFLTFLTFPTYFPACVCAPAYRRASAQACVRGRARLPTFTLGRLGRLGRAALDQGFEAPNLCPTSMRLGT